jgi:hypothetical protein
MNAELVKKALDMNVERLRDEHLRWADYVMLSAMLVQQSSVREVAARCAVLGKEIIAYHRRSHSLRHCRGNR